MGENYDGGMKVQPLIFAQQQFYSYACYLGVKGCLRKYVGIATGLPRIADDLLQRQSRQSRVTRDAPQPGRSQYKLKFMAADRKSLPGSSE
jgi:hypothetical protein